MRSNEQAALYSQVYLAVLLAACLIGGTGCASFNPSPLSDEALLSRAQIITNGTLTVSVIRLSDQEVARAFDLPLITAGIQPLWVRVRNDGPEACWLLPAVTDPYYYSAAEALQKVKSTGWHSLQKNRKKYLFLEEEQMDDCIPAGSVQQGFIYATYREGLRQVAVTLFSRKRMTRFVFLPESNARMRSDYRAVDFKQLYAPEKYVRLTPTNLCEQISKLPASTMNATGTRTGDPLNLVLIGTREEVFSALVGAGWDETEALSMGSAIRTVSALVSGSSYRFSPISPLYVFGRRQDAAFQKIRKNIHTRLHMRLWLTPYLYENKSIWIGQISRDIGIRMTTQTPNLTTHLIDPDVDGDRWFLIQELLKQQCLAQIGFAEGGASFTPMNPGRNLTGDLFYSDGLRAVLLLSNEPMAVDEVGFWSWKFPPRGGLSHPGDYLLIEE